MDKKVVYTLLKKYFYLLANVVSSQKLTDLCKQSHLYWSSYFLRYEEISWFWAKNLVCSCLEVVYSVEEGHVGDQEEKDGLQEHGDPVVEPPPRDGQGHLHYPLPYPAYPPHLHQPVFMVSSFMYIFRLYIGIPRFAQKFWKCSASWILSLITNTLEYFKHTFSFILSLFCSFWDNGTKFREKIPL